MNRLIKSLGAMMGLSRNSATSLATPVEFSQEYAAKLRLAFPKVTVQIQKDLELKLKNEKGGENFVYLYNAYDQYKLAPAHKSEIIDRFVSAVPEPTKGTVVIDKNLIVPIIKDRPWAQEVAASLKARGATPVKEMITEDYNEDLIIVYAEDSPKNVKYFSSEELSETGLRPEELREIAVENLKRLLTKIEMRRGPNVSMFVAGGDYEASLLLFDKLWNSDQMKVDGEIVVAIPTRDVLLATGSNNQEGLSQMRRMVDEAMAAGSYRLTGNLFVWRHGKFQRFVPDAG
jgi:uncharacterized protein YtpQ (UPF0354 family)